MLLRVDKVTGGNKPSDPQPSFDPPLHACLATAPVQDSSNGNGGGANDAGDATQAQGGGGSQLIGGIPHAVIPASPDPGASDLNRTGEILTVGRKNCDATLEDKCCSRNHATISLLSNRAWDDEEAALAKEALGGRATMEFGAPSTPEEVRACETSPSGVICVVRDNGSKFGTFVSVDEELLRAQQRPPANDDGDGAAAGAGGDDGDETGDETDDEGATAAKPIEYVQLSDNQVRAVRLLSDADDDSGSGADVPMPKFIKLAPRQSAPLLQLSHSEHTKNPHVLLLFGPQGSAVRLSLLPLRLTFSRVKKHELDPLLACLHYVGASHAAQWDVDGTTHLVAPEKTAAAKGIMAYACRRPVVTRGFVEALLDRRGPGDALPREEDYRPAGTWDNNLKYTAEPSTALKGYRIFVMVDDDNAPLARSAGADVLRIHEEAPSSSRAEFEAWWTAQTRRASEERMAPVVVGSASRRCKRFLEWLRLDEAVRFTNAKNIAKAITARNGEGGPLMDATKVEIEKVEGWDADEAGGGNAIEENATMLAVDAAVTAVAPQEENDPSVERNRQDFENPPRGDDDPEEEEPRGEEMPRSTRRKRHPEQEVEEVREERSEWKKRRRGNAEEEAPGERLLEEEAAMDGPAVENEMSQRKRTHEEEPPAEEEVRYEPVAARNAEKAPDSAKRRRKDEDSSGDDEPGLPAERLPLPTMRDGWMVAAPRRRKAYRREVAEDENEDIPDAAAETETVLGLVVRKYVPLSKDSIRGKTNCNGKTKDFKRFRKNSVLRGYTSFGASGRQDNNNAFLPRIRLVDVMPQESERQRQLQQYQADLEREQELADQLFNDAGARSGRKRGGAGSMHAYLTQSTTKRGRGRR